MATNKTTLFKQRIRVMFINKYLTDEWQSIAKMGTDLGSASIMDMAARQMIQHRKRVTPAGVTVHEFRRVAQ